MDDFFIECPHCGKQTNQNNDFCSHCYKPLPTKYRSQKQKLILQAIFIIIIMGTFGAALFLRIKQKNALVSQTADTGIDVTQEAFLEPITPKEYDIKRADAPVKITLQAKYVLAGVVVAKNENFWTSGIRPGRFDKIVTVDLGMAWGKITNGSFLKNNCSFESNKVFFSGEFARQLSWSCHNASNFDFSYTVSHISHNHIIAANNNIALALKMVSVWDKIKLEGYLVDVESNGEKYLTSLSLSDDNKTARGGGACEIFYVTGIHLGKNYYQ